MTKKWKTVTVMSSKAPLCSVCRTIDFEKLCSGDLDGDIYLGTLQSIHQKKSECSFCGLIVKSAGSEYVDRTVESNFHAHDGRLISCFVKYQYTGWSALEHEKEKSDVSVGIHFDGHWDPEYNGLTNTARRLASDRDIGSLFCGRLLHADHIDFETIKSWISICTTSHTSVREISGCGTRTWETTQKRSNNLKVIDVRNDCVLTLPKGQSYIALSYVWGQVPTLMATKENRDALSQPGGLSRAAKSVPIPKTILDAIMVTRSLNVQYLWVDSLCIVQNDEAEKLRLIDEMASVYLAALVTIIAATGSSASAGLPGVQPKSRHVEQDIARVSPELSLVLGREPGLDIDSSTWNTRGWTFQERLYSKRLLVFLPDRIYWQCRSVLWDEDIIQDHPSAQDNRMMDHQTRLRFLNPDQDWIAKVPADLSPSRPGLLLLRHPAMNEYDWVVHEYTRRRLTYPDDIERAFNGVLSVLKLGLKQFQCGLPVIYLDTAILWQPEAALVRRSGLATKFPTWSWMGWIGSVSQSVNVKRPENIDEERARPLLHWFRVEPNGSLTRLRQSWEDMFDHITQSEFLLDQWKPLRQPEGMYSSPPKLGTYPKISYAHSVHLTFRSCIANFAIRTSQFTKSSTSRTHDIYREQQWVGTAKFHDTASVESNCDFIVLSEAQLSGASELDKDSREYDDHFNFFNVLAVSWDKKLQSQDKNNDTSYCDHALLVYRRGLGVILKEAWAKTSMRWTDIILG